jgi:hypothetical protein
MSAPAAIIMIMITDGSDDHDDPDAGAIFAWPGPGRSDSAGPGLTNKLITRIMMIA